MERNWLREPCNFKEVIKLYTFFTAEYQEVLELEEGKDYRAIVITNTTDKDVKIKFISNKDVENEITVYANEKFALDNFIINGVIEAKFVEAVSSGRLRIWCW